MSDRLIQCSERAEILNDAPSDGERAPCASCGSTLRTIMVIVTDEIQLKEKMNIKAKRPSLRGKGGIFNEQLIGDDLHRKSGKSYKKERVIDREHNRYLERITDPDTGQVIHYCHEALTEHWGHGSAQR